MELTESQAAERLCRGADDLGRRGAVLPSPGGMAKEATTRTNRTAINTIPTTSCIKTAPLLVSFVIGRA